MRAVLLEKFCLRFPRLAIQLHITNMKTEQEVDEIELKIRAARNDPEFMAMVELIMERERQTLDALID